MLLVEGPDHDPVRVHEVLDPASLREELGVRDVADLRIELGSDPLARTDRDRALHDQNRAFRRPEISDHGPDRRQVRLARGPRRRFHAGEEDPRVRFQLVHVERERQPLAIALDQLREAGLVERDAPRVQLLDLRRHDVPDDDVVPEIGEAGARDEADPPGPEDAEGLLPGAHARKSTCGRA